MSPVSPSSSRRATRTAVRPPWDGEPPWDFDPPWCIIEPCSMSPPSFARNGLRDPEDRPVTDQRAPTRYMPP